jgi:hypothetical protein
MYAHYICCILTYKHAGKSNRYIIKYVDKVYTRYILSDCILKYYFNLCNVNLTSINSLFFDIVIRVFIT